MAQRDVQMESDEFLEMILSLKRSQMRQVGVLPVVTVMPGCAAFVEPGDGRLRRRLLGLEAGSAQPAC